MLERIYSESEINAILERPEISEYQVLFNPDFIYYKVLDGLIFYEPYKSVAFLHTAIVTMPDRPAEALRANFEQVKELGFKKVWAVIDFGHKRACMMARAAGMKRVDFEHSNLFERVL